MQNSNKKINTLLFLLVMTFVLPMIASWLLYHYHDHFQFKKMNHGLLVSPSINVTYLKKDNAKVWQVIHVDGGNCDDQCQKINYQLVQVNKALGKDHDRVQVIKISGNDQQIAKLQSAFAANEKNSKFLVTSKIYLVDPLGNLFMYYPDTINPMNILKDLKRVLEVSQIG